MKNISHVWRTIAEGGDVVYVILGIAVIAVAYCVYCFLFLRRKTLLPDDLVEMSVKLDCSSDFMAAEGYLKKTGGPLADILHAVLISRNMTREEADTLVEGSGKRAAHFLNKGITALEVIAGISPLLGLLGTVTGMYTVFGKIANVGAGEVGQLSGGIAEALVTTIAGLIVGIPAYVAYSYFSRKSDEYIMEMERLAVVLMQRVRS